MTTRIKGILSDGNEVQLELLGLQEAVELLAGVAEINASQIPPVCLEIAQLWYIHIDYSLTIAMTPYIYQAAGFRCV